MFEGEKATVSARRGGVEYIGVFEVYASTPKERVTTAMIHHAWMLRLAGITEEEDGGES